jgi:hypothetical protein
MLGKMRPVNGGIVTGPDYITPAVKSDHHGQLLAPLTRGYEYVEGEAIFTLRVVKAGPRYRQLRTGVGIVDALSDARPSTRSLRGSPSEIADRRCSIGNAAEDDDLIEVIADQGSGTS